MEIVAPGGSPQSFEAAVKAGADAVYAGLKGFGARRNAVNFTLEEMLKYIDYAHERGVKVYLTINTIMKDKEIKAVYQNLKTLYEAGIDAFIIQDMGMYKFIRDNFPDIQIHGSTQIGASNSIECDFLYEEGFSRVVLPRELNIDMIREIKKKTKIELEVFVSGSLCLCYSGKCYMSSFVGGRSGNRGMCAQPCRKNYKNDAGKEGYFLSPKDQLMGRKEIELLKNIGVESIKIEGRMKDEKYVYEMVRYYKELIAGNETENRAEKLFNRGYGKGYFYGADQKLINKEFSSDFGYEIAKKINKNEVRLTEDVMLGDGISFVNYSKKVFGGEYVSKLVNKANKTLKEAKKGDIIYLNGMSKDTDLIYKTFDKKINDEIESEIKIAEKRIPIEFNLKLEIGKKTELTAKSCGLEAVVFGEITEKAQKSIVKEDITKIISETGNTSFVPKKIDLEYDGQAFISFKTLKELRRDVCDKLKIKIIESFRRKNAKDAVLVCVDEINGDKNNEIVLAVRVSNDYQEEIVKANAIKYGISKIYRESSVVLAEGKKYSIGKSLIKNITSLIKNKNEDIAVDYEMNVFNSYAMKYYEKFDNISTVYVSPELSKDEISEISTTRLKKGMVVYGKFRLMYIAADISKPMIIENENSDKYRVGENLEGSTEVFMTKPFNIMEKIDELKNIGITEARVDFTDESSDEIIAVLENMKNRIGWEPYNFEKGVF